MGGGAAVRNADCGIRNAELGRLNARFPGDRRRPPGVKPEVSRDAPLETE